MCWTARAFSNQPGLSGHFSDPRLVFHQHTFGFLLTAAALTCRIIVDCVYVCLSINLVHLWGYLICSCRDIWFFYILNFNNFPANYILISHFCTHLSTKMSFLCFHIMLLCPRLPWYGGIMLAACRKRLIFPWKYSTWTFGPQTQGENCLFLTMIANLVMILSKDKRRFEFVACISACFPARVWSPRVSCVRDEFWQTYQIWRLHLMWSYWLCQTVIFSSCSRASQLGGKHPGWGRSSQLEKGWIIESRLEKSRRVVSKSCWFVWINQQDPLDR